MLLQTLQHGVNKSDKIGLTDIFREGFLWFEYFFEKEDRRVQIRVQQSGKSNQLFQGYFILLAQIFAGGD